MTPSEHALGVARMRDRPTRVVVALGLCEDIAVPLSEDEQRILSEIEDQLYETDPALAKEVGSTTVYSHASRNLRWASRVRGRPCHHGAYAQRPLHRSIRRLPGHAGGGPLLRAERSQVPEFSSSRSPCVRGGYATRWRARARCFVTGSVTRTILTNRRVPEGKLKVSDETAGGGRARRSNAVSEWSASRRRP